MSDSTGPKRLPRSVYIRRRIAVLVGLLALIAVIVMLVVGPNRIAAWFSPEQRLAVPTESPASEPGSAATGSEPSGEEPSADEGSKDTDVKECPSSLIAVEAVTDATQYAPDERPKFSLRVTHHGDVPCDIDLGTTTMAFTVTSGSEFYWDSRDCQVNPESFLVRMEPKQVLESQPFEWERVRSTPESCDDERPEVPGGGASYHLRAEVGGVASTQTRQFILQ